MAIVDFHCIMFLLNFVLFFSHTVLSLHIIGPETCSIPYLVPRAFQFSCDLSDAYYEPTVRVATESGVELSFVTPPEFIASSFSRRTPNLWTHEPFCLESLEAKNTFCVYTNAHFARGRGVSLISTPEQILDIGSTPIFKDGEHMKSLNTAPGAKKYTRSAVPGEKQFIITADAKFKRGENIHTFTPILALQHDANDLLLDTDLALLLRVGIDRLPIASQILFLDQYHGGFGDDFIERIDKNSFTSYIGKTPHYFLQALPENAVSSHSSQPKIPLTNEKALQPRLQTKYRIPIRPPNLHPPNKRKPTHPPWQRNNSLLHIPLPKHHRPQLKTNTTMGFQLHLLFMHRISKTHRPLRHPHNSDSKTCITTIPTPPRAKTRYREGRTNRQIA